MSQQRREQKSKARKQLFSPKPGQHWKRTALPPGGESLRGGEVIKCESFSRVLYSQCTMHEERYFV